MLRLGEKGENFLRAKILCYTVFEDRFRSLLWQGWKLLGHLNYGSTMKQATFSTMPTAKENKRHRLTIVITRFYSLLWQRGKLLGWLNYVQALVGDKLRSIQLACETNGAEQGLILWYRTPLLLDVLGHVEGGASKCDRNYISTSVVLIEYPHHSAVSPSRTAI